MKELSGKVALVSGATRGAGRAIAVELGEAGATVYVTGRSTIGQPSAMNRQETIEETAELVTAHGGTGIAVRTDHTEIEQVEKLVRQIDTEQNGQLDILVNDVWGGDPLVQFGVKFWEQDLAKGLFLQKQAVHSHIITSWHAVPLMVRRKSGLIIEISDGISAKYRGAFFYDLAKSAVNRLALAQAEELREFNITALALSPGYLRSEAMLDHFKVSQSNWQDAITQDEHFAQSETPYYVARAVRALAGDQNIMSKSGLALATWTLYKEYGFTDLDGSQPDWGAYAREKFEQQ